MMHDPKLVEAMAQAMWYAHGPHAYPWSLAQAETRAVFRRVAIASLSAICAARPDVAAVLAGDAVEVAVVNAQ